MRVIVLLLVFTVPMSPVLSRPDLGVCGDPAGGTRAERSDPGCGKLGEVNGQRDHTEDLKGLPPFAFLRTEVQGKDSLHTVCIPIDNDMDVIHNQRNAPLAILSCRHIFCEEPSACRDPKGGIGVRPAIISLTVSSTHLSCVILRC
jgi:hypothetical protein